MKTRIHLLDNYKSQGIKIQVDMYSNYDVTAKKQKIKKHYTHNLEKQIFISKILPL